VGDIGFSDAEEIERGGFGVVYRCIHKLFERKALFVKVRQA